MAATVLHDAIINYGEIIELENFLNNIKLFHSNANELNKMLETLGKIKKPVKRYLKVYEKEQVLDNDVAANPIADKLAQFEAIKKDVITLLSDGQEDERSKFIEYIETHIKETVENDHPEKFEQIIKPARSEAWGNDQNFKFKDWLRVMETSPEFADFMKANEQLTKTYTALKSYMKALNGRKLIDEIYSTEKTFIDGSQQFPVEKFIALIGQYAPQYFIKHPQLENLVRRYHQFENHLPYLVSYALDFESIDSSAQHLMQLLNQEKMLTEHWHQLTAFTKDYDIINELFDIIRPKLLQGNVQDLALEERLRNTINLPMQRTMRYKDLLNTLQGSTATDLSETTERYESKANRINKIKRQEETASTEEEVPANPIRKKIRESVVNKNMSIKLQQINFIGRKQADLRQTILLLENKKRLGRSGKKQMFENKIAGINAIITNLDMLADRISREDDHFKTSSIDFLTDFIQCFTNAKEQYSDLNLGDNLKRIMEDAAQLAKCIEIQQQNYLTFQSEDHFIIVQTLKMRYLESKIAQLDGQIKQYQARIQEEGDTVKRRVYEKHTGLIELRENIKAFLQQIQDKPTVLHEVKVNFSEELGNFIYSCQENKEKITKGFFSQTRRYLTKYLPKQLEQVDILLTEAVKNPSYAAKLLETSEFFPPTVLINIPNEQVNRAPVQ